MTDSLTTATLPSWAEALRSKYLAGESVQFLLHGNVGDLVPYEGDYLTLRDFLYRGMLKVTKEAVVYFDNSEGITFAARDMKKIFLQGLNARQSILGGAPVPPELPKGPGQALPLLEQYLAIPGNRAGVIIDYAETIIPAAEASFMTSEDRTNLVTLLRWASDPRLLNSDNVIILLTESLSDIHRKVVRNPHISTLEIPMPDQQDRLEFIQNRQAKLQIQMEMPPEMLAKLTAGLRRIQIDGLFRQARKSGQPITWQLLREQRKEIIENECFGLVDLLEARFNLDAVGGLEPTKQVLRKVAEDIREGVTRRVPMGIMFVGPMGTGKSFLAEAFTGESGLTCLQLKNFREKWVGSTESNLEKILRIIKALGNVIVIVDEVDRALGGEMEGDSGVSSRIFATLKAFMADTSHRGKILWLVMTNRPDKLDVDMKRPGRFDRKIPFFFPDTDGEREAVFRAVLKKNRVQCGVEDFAEATRLTAGYSGADLEAIVLLADEFASERGEGTVAEGDLIQAIKDFIPNRDRAMIGYMELLAVFEASSRRMLPERFRSMKDEDLNQRLGQLQRELRL